MIRIRILRTTFGIATLFAILTSIAASNDVATPTAAPSVDAIRVLENLRTIHASETEQRARYRRPSFLPTPANGDLNALRPFFTPLFAFHPTGRASMTYLQTMDVIQSAYESDGTLYFVTEPGASMHVDTLHALSDGHVQTVHLPQGNFETLYFVNATPKSAILQGSRSTDRGFHNWTLTEGRFRVRKGDVTIMDGLMEYPQTPRPPTCVIRDGATTFVAAADRASVTVTRRALSDATQGIALENGIVIGCRRIGTTQLLWLTQDAHSDDGVTYEIDGSTLRPLFLGHPFLQTTHYLVFKGMDGNGPVRNYLFLSDIPDTRRPHT